MLLHVGQRPDRYLPPAAADTPRALAEKYAAYFGQGGGLRRAVSAEWQGHLATFELPAQPRLAAEVDRLPEHRLARPPPRGSRHLGRASAAARHHGRRQR